MTGRITEDHLIDSVAEALQYISYYHSPDFVQAMGAALEAEESQSARNAITQILINSRMAAIGKRPICQDTGSVNAILKVGVQAPIDWTRSPQALIDEATRRAYDFAANPLRASIVEDPLGKRRNTRDNTPAMIQTELVEGDKVSVTVSAKGGGSENKTKFAVLNPSDSVADWVVETVKALGAGWCPPGIIGLGIGGSVDKAMAMAKEALNEPIDITALRARGAQTPEEALRLELYERINALGIGAQGLGGLVTVLDVKVNSFPTHAASLPVALIPNCAATRHMHFTLDGSGPARFETPDLSLWPDLGDGSMDGRRVDLDALDDTVLESLSPGDTLLLSGRLYTGRDAAHRRMLEELDQGKPLPVDLEGRAIYYVGPVDAVGDEVIGPAGPTTSTRMDKFTGPLLAASGLKVMIGKAERGPAAIEAIKAHGAVYLIAVGGAAYLVSKAIKSARPVAYQDLGMEAIYEIEVRDMPVTVAVDTRGASIHQSGPRQWARNR
ncbi:homodimeric fumarase (class I) [Roseovarius halotolerans]|uniref:Fumarate hydratase class I n=1 Tax=Roseovarius halotolerans TaxID=505353 RepID=A0A1X6YZA0_9RHOB|nr:fumarate hydratase [Roseovarius halotolerans]RKT32549.1 homodimeric fumarase (class I) [Roseovarius halotolerans]SLN35738.1 Fumarate hydratase class I, aerobic [Roseovarius halotolerans]